MERPGNMLPNGGQPQPNMALNGMQRPQSGNTGQQIHAQIMTTLRSKMHSIPPGWQQTFDIGQRANAIMQLVTQLRLLQQQADKCIEIAQNFEERCLLESPSKDIYFQKIHSKLGDIQAKRAQQAPQVGQLGQMGMPMNGGNMGMPQNNLGNPNLAQGNGMMGMSMGMNMNMGNQGMNMANGQLGGQQNQSFPAQLQRPMQPSPLPAQQQQQQQANFTMDPSALQNPQMTAQPTNMNQPNTQQAPNANQTQQPQPGQVVVQQQITALARQLFNNTSEERRAQLRVQAINQQNESGQPLPPNVDPLHRYFMIQAREMFIKQRRAAQMSQAGSQNGGMQMGTNGGMANAMQQTASQTGAQSFDFTSMLGQQANAIKSQESGEQVVPASNNPNNNMNLGGQMNMPQGANPQAAAANQNNQAGNNAQLQQFLAMQEKQRREQQQRALQEKAQQQGMQNQGVGMQAQQSQLRGQPGGLGGQNTLNGGQVHSPAMNMLNRPMAPPGQQQNPPTPQQNRQGMSQTPVNGANQLAQHHQSMVNRNNQQMNQAGPGMTQRQQMLDGLPQVIRERLSQLGPEQVNMVLARYYAQNNNAAANNQQAANGAQPNMNAGGGPMGNRTGAGIPPNMQSAVPGFNSQPPMNQQGQQASNGQSVQLQQRMQQHQQAQFKQKALDLMPFPKSVLSVLGVAPPDGVSEWGKLKQHTSQNQAVLPPNTLQRIQNAQAQYFEAHPDEARQAILNLQQRMQQVALAQQQAGQQPPQPQQQQQQTPVSRPPSSMAMPTGQVAPQAQMVPPPNAGMQQQQNQPGLNVGPQAGVRPQPPTQQDIQTFRQKVPNAQSLTDEQIRNAIMHRKMQQANEQAITLQQQSQLKLRMQRAQALGNVQQPNAQQGTHQAQTQSQPQAQQQTQQPARPNQPQAAAKQQQQSNTPVQGQKRPQSSTDDVMEIPNPNVGKPPQTAPMRANASQQQNQQPQGQMRAPTQEEFSKMTPEQQQSLVAKMRQLDALRKAQGAAPQQGAQPAQPAPAPAPTPAQAQANRPQGQANTFGMPPEEYAKTRALYNEINNAHPKGPDAYLDAKQKEQVQASLKKLWPLMPSIFYTTPLAMRIPSFGEKRVREAIRWHCVIQQNAADASGVPKPGENYSVTPAQLKQAENFIGHYAAEIKAIRDAAGKQAQQGTNGAQTQQQGKAQQPPAKAQQAQQTQQAAPKSQAPSRKASASTKAPPAPTDNNKTFDWGSPSPHGVPKYQQTSNELTADKLKIPAQKKRKTGPQSEAQDVKAAPQAITSPKVVDVKQQSTQEQQPKMQPAQPEQKPVVEEKAKFKCDDVFCDASVNGFETEAQLKEHKETEHQPIENPLQFLLDSAADALGLDRDGNPLPEKKEVKTATQQARAAPSTAAAASKKGTQTPATKPGSATGTPLSASKATSKTSAPTPGKKDTDVKAPVSGTEVEEKEKTLYEVMCERIGFELPPKKDDAPSAAAAPTETTDTDPWITNFQNNLSHFVDGLDDDEYGVPDFSQVTDWGPVDNLPMPEMYSSSPELTPESEASRESNISRNERLRINLSWDPFNCGDTYVPEILRLKGLGLDGGKKDGDVAMRDVDDKEKTAEQKAEEEKWNWDGDLDWDAMFGPNAGLDPNVDYLYNAMRGL